MFMEQYSILIKMVFIGIHENIFLRVHIFWLQAFPTFNKISLNFTRIAVLEERLKVYQAFAYRVYSSFTRIYVVWIYFIPRTFHIRFY